MAEHDSFIDIVCRVWSLDVCGSRQYSVCMKLKALKAELKKLHSTHFSHISSRAREAKLALYEAQSHLLSDLGVFRTPNT